jgi:hypothetical protein
VLAKQVFELFPVSAPSRAAWNDVDAIVGVLNVIGNISNLNHLFFPGGGGMDLKRVTDSRRCVSPRSEEEVPDLVCHDTT